MDSIVIRSRRVVTDQVLTAPASLATREPGLLRRTHIWVRWFRREVSRKSR